MYWKEYKETNPSQTLITSACFKSSHIHQICKILRVSASLNSHGVRGGPVPSPQGWGLKSHHHSESMLTGPQTSVPGVPWWGSGMAGPLDSELGLRMQRGVLVPDFAGRGELGGVICAVTVPWHLGMAGPRSRCHQPPEGCLCQRKVSCE